MFLKWDSYFKPWQIVGLLFNFPFTEQDAPFEVAVKNTSPYFKHFNIKILKTATQLHHKTQSG